MSDTTSSTVVRLEAAQAQVRQHFLGWQCRLRQKAVREHGGRPTQGMCPDIVLDGQQDAIGQITVLIVPNDPYESTALFRHTARRTQDPNERYKSVVKHLSSTYYQYPDSFSDELTALFGPDSDLAKRLHSDRACTLRFDQYSQRYSLPCQVRSLTESEPAYQATYWHNSLFNPNIPGEITILAFKPDWSVAEADPDVA